jgi:hypothetical protein
MPSAVGVSRPAVSGTRAAAAEQGTMARAIVRPSPSSLMTVPDANAPASPPTRPTLNARPSSAAVIPRSRTT